MLNTITNYYRHVLMQEYNRRKGKNVRYSARSFARDLDLDIATLSRVFAGKSCLTIASGKKVLPILQLSKDEQTLFLESIADAQKVRSLKHESLAPSATDEVCHIEQDQFEVISNLCHYAILELVQTDDFVPDVRKIGKSLKLTVIEVEQAIQRLVRIGLLKRDGQTLVKTHSFITTNDKAKSSEALRNHQRQILRNALIRLDAESVDKRIMSGMTIPIDTEKLPVARELIDEFCKKMAHVMSAGKRRSVYQLQVNFCSLMATENVNN